LPPAVIGAADILSLAQLVERMRRIIPHCEVQRRTEWFSPDQGNPAGFLLFPVIATSGQVDDDKTCPRRQRRITRRATSTMTIVMPLELMPPLGKRGVVFE